MGEKTVRGSNRPSAEKKDFWMKVLTLLVGTVGVVGIAFCWAMSETLLCLLGLNFVLVCIVWVKVEILEEKG